MVPYLETPLQKSLSATQNSDKTDLLDPNPSEPAACACACAAAAGRTALSPAPRFASGSLGLALHAPAGVVRRLLGVGFSRCCDSEELLGQPVSPGVLEGKSAWGPRWSLSPRMGFLPSRRREALSALGSQEPPGAGHQPNLALFVLCGIRPLRGGFPSSSSPASFS